MQLQEQTLLTLAAAEVVVMEMVVVDQHQAEQVVVEQDKPLQMEETVQLTLVAVEVVEEVSRV